MTAIVVQPRAFAWRLLAAGLAVVVGAASVAVAHRVDDRSTAAVLLGLALVPALILAILSKPIVGAAVVFLVFPNGSIDVALPGAGFAAPLVLLTVLAVVALVALRRLALGQAPLGWASALWWPLALLSWSVVSLTSAQDTTLALKQIVVLAGGLLFACVVYSTVESMEDVRWVLGAFLAIALYVVVSAASSGVTFRDQFGGQTVEGRLSGAFNHPNQLGLFAALAVCVGVGLAFGARTRAGRLLASAVALASLIPLVLALSRGAWIGCGFAFVYFVVALAEARRALLIAIVPLAVVGTLVGSFAPSSPEVQIIGERARALTALSPYDERTQIYAEAEREIRANPILGVGPGNYPVASERALYAEATVSSEHAHNLWLTWAAEVGIPAVAIIIAFMIALARVARSTGRAAARSRRDRAVIAGIVAALLATVGQGLFDYLLRNAVLFMVIWALIGLLLACARIFGSPAESRSDQLEAM